MPIAVIAAVAASARGAAPGPSAEGPSFTHLIGIGSVTDGSATYRARASGAATLQIEYSENSDLSSSVTSAGVEVVEDDDFTGGETFTGLSADTTYYYRILVDGIPSHASGFPVFHTCPTAGVATSFRFCPVSCNLGPYGPAFASVGAEDPLFLLHLGDWVYADTSNIDLLRGGPDTASYENRGSGLKTYYRPLYEPETDASVHIVTKMWRDHTWSDHEYMANEDGDYASKATALKVFKEYAVFHPLENPTQGVWHKFTVAHCEFFVTDGRYQREGGKQRFPSTATELTPDSGSSGTALVIPASANPSAFNDFYNGYYVKFADGTVNRITDYVASTRTLTMDGNLGTGDFHMRRASYLDMDKIANGQTDWLIDGINNSTATFKFICSPEPMNLTATGWSDSFSGWDADQMELRYLHQRITADNVIVLAGDRHLQAVDDGTNAGWPEVVTSRLVQDGSSLSGTWSHGSQTNSEGYVVVDVAADTVTITVKKADGTTAPGVTQLVVTAA